MQKIHLMFHRFQHQKQDEGDCECCKLTYHPHRMTQIERQSHAAIYLHNYRNLCRKWKKKEYKLPHITAKNVHKYFLKAAALNQQLSCIEETV